MGQILIRGIPEDVMRAFKERAKRHGRSQEQEARMLIEEAARESESWERFAEFAERMREELRRRGDDWGDSTEIIRWYRDHR
jgi:plasmid stability protein